MRIEVKQGKRVPHWVVEHIGCKVRLSKPFKDAIGTVYPAGSMGLLQSIQAGRRSAYCTVVLDEDKGEAEENFQFSDLRPL